MSEEGTEDVGGLYVERELLDKTPKGKLTLVLTGRILPQPEVVEERERRAGQEREEAINAQLDRNEADALERASRELALETPEFNQTGDNQSIMSGQETPPIVQNTDKPGFVSRVMSTLFSALKKYTVSLVNERF